MPTLDEVLVANEVSPQYIRPSPAKRSCVSPTDDATQTVLAVSDDFHNFSLEAPLESDECALTASNYKVASTVGFRPDYMIASPLLVDTGATMNLVHYNFLPPQWKDEIQPYSGSTVKSANKSSLDIVGVIRLYVRVGTLRVKVRFGVVRHLVTRILVGTPFVNKFVKGIFPQEQRIVPADSDPVPILATNSPEMLTHREIMALGDNVSDVTESDCESRDSLFDGPEELTTAATELLTLQAARDDNIRVAKKTFLQPWSETPVLVKCAIPGLIIINPLQEGRDRRLYRAARGVYDNYPGKDFYILVANLSSRRVRLPPNTKLAVAQDVPDIIVATDMDTPPQAEAEREQESPVPETHQSDERVDPSVYERNTNTDPHRSVVRTKKVNWQQAHEDKAPVQTDTPDWRDTLRIDGKFSDLRERVVSLLEPFQSMWDGTLGELKATEHRIDLMPDSKPVHQAPYRAGPTQRQREKEEIDNMLAKGVIEPANTEWASPIVFVPKSDGSLRFCVDYRRLNAMTIRDSYPIPRMDECLDSLGDAVVFSTLDCNSGYWQIPVAERDRDKTAFVSHFGLYRWLRMPFGLKNAPATFQRAADVILAAVKWQFALVYLDDVIVYSKSVEEHFDHLAYVLRLLQKAGLTLKLPKCEFFRESVDYLGHIISPGKLNVAHRATEAFSKALPPRNVTELRSFLGLCNVYRRFVPNFARLSKPLNRMLEKGHPTEWSDLTDDQLGAFETLKSRLTNPPVLTLPRAGQSYILDTDACQTQVGCVLLQEQEDGSAPKQIGYWSRTLSSAERNYTTTERECLAIVWSILMLRPYLDGSEFTIRTDHDSLKWLLNLSDASGRLQRWRLRLQEFTYDIQYRPGAQHKAADAVSRLSTTGHDDEPIDDDLPVLALTDVDTTQAYGPSPDDTWLVSKVYPLDSPREAVLPQVIALTRDQTDVQAISRDELIAEQREDSTCQTYMQEAQQTYSLFTVQPDGLLVRRSPHDGVVQMVVPESLQPRVLYLSHYPLLAGHPKSSRMYDSMRRNYFWRRMLDDVVQTCNDCRPCAEARGTRYKTQKPMKLFPAGKPLEFVAMDLLGPFPTTESGFTNILVTTDRFSKLAQVTPLKTTTAPVVANAFVEHWFIPYGMPSFLLTDNGPQFVAKFFESIGLLFRHQAFDYDSLSSTRERADRALQSDACDTPSDLYEPAQQGLGQTHSASHLRVQCTGASND